MPQWTRRAFARAAAAAWLPAVLGAPAVLAQSPKGRARPRVLVVGGGVAGATAAKHLALARGPGGVRALDVTLVEPRPRYATCFFSNLYLAGLRPFATLTHGYDVLAKQYGVAIRHDEAVAVDPVRRTVRLEAGGTLGYDRLVVAPGIAFRPDAITHYDAAAAEAMPHAWIAGPQTLLLRRQVEGMRNGGVFVLVAPPVPSRCPPAPYERVSLLAAYFRRHKPRAKILILDAKDGFTQQELFQEAWQRRYPGMIEWLPAQFHGGLRAVNVKTRTILTADDRYKADVANVIPAQMAGALAPRAGLADGTGWCPVEPHGFESTLQPGIHVLGDAAIAGAMPKSAYAANSQAKLCALAIAAALGVPQADAAGSATPGLAGACYTFLGPDEAIREIGSYAVVGPAIRLSESQSSKLGESAATRAETARDAMGWYDSITADVFG